MAEYGSKAKQKMKKAMHERKTGTLKSGKSGKTVKSRKQAIAIGLSEARRAGAKVPSPKKSGSSKASGARKKASSTKGAARKSTAKGSTTKKTKTRTRKRRAVATKPAGSSATARRRASVTKTAGAKSSRSSGKAGASSPAS